MVCLLLAISLIPQGSAQTENPEPLLPDLPVWVATESLEANTTTLLATVELAHLPDGASAINLSLIQASKGWSFTVEATDDALAEGDNTTVQVHVRPPADAKDGDRAQAVLMVEYSREPLRNPVFLRFETPAVNGSSSIPDALVNETVDTVDSSVEENGQKKGAGTISIGEGQFNRDGGLVLGTILEGGSSVPDALDTPAPPSNPQDKSGEDWIWYMVDTAEWGYETAARKWPRDLFVIGGSVGNGRGPPDLPDFYELRHGPNEPLPPPPLRSIASMVVDSDGASQPSQTGNWTAAQEDWSFNTSFLVSTSSAQPSISSSGGGGPDMANPQPRGTSPTYDDPHSKEDRPLSSSSIEAMPTPFGPVVAAVLVLGLGAGAVIGTMAVRPEAWLGRWIAKISSSLAFTRLFSRTTGPSVLKHPLRAQIHDMISREPGITISVLASSIGVNRSTLRDHLRTLEREEMIQSRPKGRSCHYYVKGQMPAVVHATARDPLFYMHRKKLAKAILENPGQIQKQLAEEVDLPPSRVCTYTRSLVDAGLIEIKRDGRFRRYFPTETLRRVELSRC